MPDLETVRSLRLSDRLLRAARHRSRTEHVDGSSALRDIIALGSGEYASILYREGKATLREAADLAGRTRWEMLDRLGERGIKGNLAAEQERESIRIAIALTAKDTARKPMEGPWVARDRGSGGYRRTPRRKRGPRK
jgi:hypothetical protein